MPAPPKVTNRFCDIREVKVFLKMKPKDTSQTDRHIRIRREIKVNLQRIGNCSKPGKRHINTIHFKNFICQCPYIIRNNDLLCKTKYKPFQSVCNILHMYLSMCNFIFYGFVADDRTCYKLRKQRYIQHNVKRIFLCCNITTIYINDITHRLKCKERYTDRQYDRRNFNIIFDEMIDVFNKEIRVFVITEHPQIYNH